MELDVVEQTFPITFRQHDCMVLGDHLRNRHSVMLIGMKRVGISNFLRFFLRHNDIVSTYISKEEKHLFIPVDLNDLIEREIVPFWTLTLKRIADTVHHSVLPEQVKKDIEALFVTTIQSQDLFLTIDAVRKSMILLIENGILPTIFFLRFDRMKDSVNQQFFDNIQGLKDATNQKLTYVFTSFKSLDKLSPHAFSRASLSVFARNMYIKPATPQDAGIMSKTYEHKYKITLPDAQRAMLLSIVDGYVQYLQLALILLGEKKVSVTSSDALFTLLATDERILLQSEELWESVSKEEQAVLLKIAKKQPLDDTEKKVANYLWETGMVVTEGSQPALFSTLFGYFLTQKVGVPYIESTGGSDFTKKEHQLFQFLHANENDICEREQIVEAVWPEVEGSGVSDWAIDRLVARVRSKMKLQKSPYEIQTIKTRGYKLIAPS